jgi:outer membrane lipoprotein LolB
VTRVVLVLLAGVLAGCASLRAPPPAAASTMSLAALTAWVAGGRLAVAAGSEGGSGAFVWRQQGPETVLRLRGPLGAGAVEIASDGEQLSVTDAAGQVTGADAQAALRSKLKADLPLSSLRYWMVGLPDPRSTATVTESGTAPLRTIEQYGWTIAYEAFTASDGLSLPARITATSGDVRLRLTVNDWSGLQATSE